MSDYLMTILESIKEFAQETEAVMGPGTDALPRAVEQFNEVLAALEGKHPDCSAWGLVKPLDPQASTTDDLKLYCMQLTKIAEELKDEARGRPTWQVSSDTELKGVYKGDVVVEPGCTFSLLGVLKGDVTLEGDASLVCKGVLKGDVEATTDSTVDVPGILAGTVRTKEASGTPALREEVPEESEEEPSTN